MTIFGVTTSRDRVSVWADSLISAPDGAPHDEHCKLTINPLAGMIGVGAGWIALCREAAGAVLSGYDLDSAVPRVSEALRRSVVRHVAAQAPQDRFSFGGNIYVVAGWSAMAGRFVAYEMSAMSFFEPTLRTHRLVPWPACAAAAPDPVSALEVDHLAAEQAAVLREHGLEVGRLTVATITPHGIMVLPPREIAPAPTPNAGRCSIPVRLVNGAGDGAEPAPECRAPGPVEHFPSEAA